MSILFTYKTLLKDKSNDEVVYPLVEQIANTGIVDERVKKENGRALKKIEDLGERKIAQYIRDKYSKFI